MTINRGLYVPINVVEGSAIGTTPLEARLAMAGLVAENSPGVPRSGLLAQSAAAAVTGTSDMSYNLGPCNPVISRSAGDGVYTMSLTGTTNIPTTLAPQTGSRWDLIYVKQNDPSKGDPDNQPVLGVIQGVASGTPSKPYASVPEGGLVLAEAQVTAGAASTNSAGVVITQVWRHTAARGAAIPVRNTAERGELSAFTGLQVARLDYKGLVQTCHGGGWEGSMSCSGTLTVAAVPNAGSSALYTVNYPFTFPGVPVPVVTPGSGRLSGTTTQRTASSFKVIFDNRSGGGSSAADATWVAVFSLNT